MLPTLETERLIIRPFQAEDWRAIHAYTSDTETMAWMPEGVMDEAAAQKFVAANLGDDAHNHALILQATDELIGHMVFHPWFAPQTYEIGWVVHPQHQRRGYVTEAAQALLRYGFETLALHRIIATCQPENLASYRVMEKLGMRREGHFRQCIYRGNDVWWDEYFYAILGEEL